MREAQMRKTPYILVIGDSEVENDTVTYRKYGEVEKTTVSTDEFIKLITDEINNRK